MTIEHSHAVATSNPPDGKVGTFGIVIMTIAAAAPLLVIGGTSAAFLVANGAGVPFNFLLMGVILLMFTVGYMAMTPYVKDASGFYSYIRNGLGRPMAAGAAFLALFSYFAAQVCIWGFFGSAFAQTLASAGFGDVHWLPGAIMGIAVVAVFGYFRIDFSAKALTVLVALEIVVVILLSVAIAFHGGHNGALTLVSFTPAEIFSGPIGIGMVLSVGGYAGFEASTLFRREARNPDVTIPRATYITVLTIGLAYTGAVWLLVEAFGAENIRAVTQAEGANLYAHAAEIYVGAWLARLLNILLLSSILAGSVSMHNFSARYLGALGRNGLMPSWLGVLHATQATPYRASILISALVTLLILLFASLGIDPLMILALAGSFGSTVLVTLFILTSVSVIVFFRRTGLDRRLWNTLVAPGLSAIALAVVLILVLTNIEALTGLSNPILNAALGVIPFAVAAIGAAIALLMRTRDPAAYERLQENPGSEL